MSESKHSKHGLIGSTFPGKKWYNGQYEDIVLDRKGRAMANKGSSLATGAYLATNDYLVSANGLYFVIIQGDGNLCIYHGSDPAHQGAFVWMSGKAPGAGVYGATMQNDGNLVVTTGTTVLWSAQPLSTTSQPTQQPAPTVQPTGGHPNLIHVGDADFQSKVLSSPTAVIVDFWASWAGPCLSIAPVFERLSDAYQGKMLFAKLDIDANSQTPQRYNIQSIPTFIMFKGGQEIARKVDPHPTQLQSFIDDTLARNV